MNLEFNINLNILLSKDEEEPVVINSSFEEQHSPSRQKNDDNIHAETNETSTFEPAVVAPFVSTPVSLGINPEKEQSTKIREDRDLQSNENRQRAKGVSTFESFSAPDRSEYENIDQDEIISPVISTVDEPISRQSSPRRGEIKALKIVKMEVPEESPIPKMDDTLRFNYNPQNANVLQKIDPYAQITSIETKHTIESEEQELEDVLATMVEQENLNYRPSSEQSLSKDVCDVESLIESDIISSKDDFDVKPVKEEAIAVVKREVTSRVAPGSWRDFKSNRSNNASESVCSETPSSALLSPCSSSITTIPEMEECVQEDQECLPETSVPKVIYQEPRKPDVAVEKSTLSVKEAIVVKEREKIAADLAKRTREQAYEQAVASPQKKTSKLEMQRIGKLVMTDFVARIPDDGSDAHQLTHTCGIDYMLLALWHSAVHLAPLIRVELDKSRTLSTVRQAVRYVQVKRLREAKELLITTMHKQACDDESAACLNSGRTPMPPSVQQLLADRTSSEFILVRLFRTVHAFDVTVLCTNSLCVEPTHSSVRGNELYFGDDFELCATTGDCIPEPVETACAKCGCAVSRLVSNVPSSSTGTHQQQPLWLFVDASWTWSCSAEQTVAFGSIPKQLETENGSYDFVCCTFGASEHQRGERAKHGAAVFFINERFYRVENDMRRGDDLVEVNSDTQLAVNHCVYYLVSRL